MKRIYKQEDINIDISTIFNLINDVENYPNYLPWCTSTKVDRKSESLLIGEIFISKSFIKWNFSTKNKIEKNKSIRLELVDGPFDSLDGQWLFSTIDEHNTKVSLEISYKFKSSIIELSIEPIFTSIMNSILESFIQEAFKLKYDN
ncbi:MAG: type II toxin-antitoxin system RatA family toxin [Pseudomonadota bacterium]|nr:type II toxin-antitoxin system RatA family toxin [Pseudomonadota bacterium]